MSFVIDQVKDKFAQLVASRNLGKEEVKVIVKTLTPTEAIGNPERQDYPIPTGRRASTALWTIC